MTSQPFKVSSEFPDCFKIELERGDAVDFVSLPEASPVFFRAFK
jgi:hypothetical protein